MGFYLNKIRIFVKLTASIDNKMNMNRLQILMNVLAVILLISALYGVDGFVLAFATGMHGDEDLGQDITMKGEKFHYKKDAFATGMNGDEDLGQDITMKGDKFHYDRDAFATGMNGDEDLGQDITMKGDKFHY